MKKFGKIVSFTFPRLKDLKVTSTIKESALGKIFVEYSMIEEAKTAKKVIFVKKALGGRTFDNKTVECSFHSEEDYLKNNLECWIIIIWI